MPAPSISRVGDFSLVWGESLRWDDQRRRLYFVDCAAHTLHWLDGAEPPLQTWKLPSMPAGVVLTDSGVLVSCLEDGLYVLDPDAERCERLVAYPEGMGGRANDANADGHGNLITGTLNIAPGPGSAWWFSSTKGWRLIDDDIGNTNGPLVLGSGETETLILADTTAAAVYAYPYDGEQVGERRVFGDHRALNGAPDGATGDAAGGAWSCVLGAGKIARFTDGGLDELVDLPVVNPSDVTFAGAGLDRMFVTSIAVDLGRGAPTVPEDGWLLAIDGLDQVGRPEARFRL